MTMRAVGLPLLLTMAGLASACGGRSRPAVTPAPTPARQQASAEPAPARAGPDDVDGLVRELSDPALRADAVEHLTAHYLRARRVAFGARDADGPTVIAERTAAPLCRAYVDETDPQTGEAILELLAEMRSADAWPAYERALEWRAEVDEEHAIVAARAMSRGDLDALPAEVQAPALAGALGRVEGSRGVDNRMRIELIRALGRVDHPVSIDALAAVADREDEDQNFLINRMAVQQLGELANPRAIPTLLRGIVRFAPDNPAMRMNDVAADALVQIGRPSLEPALALLAGRNDEVNAIAVRYVEAVRERDPGAAAQMSAENVVAGEAAYLLGQLGFVEALDPLLAETRHADPSRRLFAAIALVSLVDLSDAQRRQVRTTLQRGYREATEPMQQMQLLVAIQHTYDPGHLRFLLRVARRADPDAPDARILAARAYAMLANAREARPLQRIIAQEPADDGLRAHLEEQLAPLDAAERCDEDVTCWTALLASDDPASVRKATYMLGRLRAATDEVRDALLALIDHPDIPVRADALYALDALSLEGDPTIVSAIDALRQREEGRSSWNQIRDLASAVRGRQRSRID